MSRRKVELGDLEVRLGFRFPPDKRLLLETALTHMSVPGADVVRSRTYQRLEFLGDRVLGLCVSDMIYAAYPFAEEGELSKRLADLVRKDSCADVALAWDVGPHLRLGASETAHGGRRNRAILADACESIIGAVYLAGGLEAAKGLVERAFGDRLTTPMRPTVDAKTALQEWAQGQGFPTPTYHELGRSGPDHAPVFNICAMVKGLGEAHGDGRSKRLAEQAAAEVFLRREGVWNGDRHDV